MRTQQTVLQEGPTSPYGQADYTLSGYVVPPVSAGSQIVIAIQGYLPNSLSLSLFPASGGDLSPSGPALLDLTNFTGAPFRVSVKAPASESYAILISSLNRTSFAIGIEGTWSLFYVLRGYVFAGFFVSVAGALATLYYWGSETRREVEEAAIRELKSQGASERLFRLGPKKS